jgi:hypothetical protein
MARKKVDVKAVAKEIIRITNNEVSSREISAVLAMTGHRIITGSVSALKAWVTING